jgi:nucleoside-diphosphate-sugar epimerase
MMRIVVTGANGKIGKEAVRALREAGHRVTGWDIAGPGPIVDCCDFGQVLGGLSGIDILGGKPDAVLHLAGIPMPGRAPDHVIFQKNTQSTYNVLWACHRLGVHRVVWASSETLLGLPFTTPPDYVPLDENHPDRPEWSYSLSKLMGEQMAEQFARWNPATSITSLRFSNVCSEEDYQKIRDNPAMVQARAANLWSYIDVRDAGNACRLALEANLSGYQVMIIAATDTLAPQPTFELLAERFPDVPVKSSLDGHISLLSSARARELIGFEAQYSWRDN